MCCPGPGSVSKESDSGPPLSFSEGIPGSLSESQLDILNDPVATAFDRSLPVRARGGVVSGVPPPWRQLGPGTVAQSCRVPSRRCRSAVEGRMRPAGVLLCENESHDHDNSSLFCGLVDSMQSAGHGGPFSSEETVALHRSSARAAGLGWNGSRQSAGVGISEFEDMEIDVPKSVPMDGMEDVSSTLRARRDTGGGRNAHATAGESVGIIGSSCDVVTRASSFYSSCGSSRACMSYLDAVLSAPARAPAAALVARCSALSSSAVGLCMHAYGSLVHDACSNSWSDTVRSQGPTGRRCTKGGVSGPAEDLRPVSEVETGVNFRPAGRVRGQVAGSLPGKQPGTGTRTGKGSVVTPSLHPEVPDSLSVSPGPGKRIRQLMGWTKVCGTAQSWIWVLKGNARACMFPANLDHLRVEWGKQGSYKTAWVTPGHDCLCSYKYGHGAAVRPQTNDAIWDGIGLWGRVAPFLSPRCGKKELPTGVNLNHYDGSRSCVRWHSDNESLFGPRDSPKLIVSLSLGNPVEFKVRRVSDSVTSSITLDHGDVLVMDGSAQLEYLHCTMPGLQGPRVNLTYRWVAQHTASCPLAGVVGCLLPSCVQGLAEPGSRLWEKWENNCPFLGNWPFFCSS